MVPNPLEILLFGLTTYAEVIEAVVTNNVGYNPNKERPWSHGKFIYVNCEGLSHDEAVRTDPNNICLPKIVTDNPDIMNLHWHLGKLEDEHVMLPWDETYTPGRSFRSKRLPFICTGTNWTVLQMS